MIFLVKEDIDQDNNAKKAHRTYLKGRTLNVVPDHSPEAEQLLSKAVKLEPNLVDAWIELGECYWKRGDVETAKTCFEGALSHVSSDSFAKTCLHLPWNKQSGSKKKIEISIISMVFFKA